MIYVNCWGNIQFIEYWFIDYVFGLFLEKYYVDNGCQSEQEFGETNLAGTFQPKFFKAGVLCCDTTGYRCASGNNRICTKNKVYFDEAVSQCQNAGMRLCTRDELLSNICCKTGSSCHSNPVWTSTKEPGRVWFWLVSQIDCLFNLSLD